jgi:hypothetical protein
MASFSSSPPARPRNRARTFSEAASTLFDSAW